METLMYFNNENEVREYANANGIEYIDRTIEVANEGINYYAPFKEIEGCELLYCLRGKELFLCIRWKGITMCANTRYCYDEKTYGFRLCEEMDWEGLNGYRFSVSKDGCPRKIGIPTAKKLDEWVNWLLGYRQREKESKERAFASMVAKISEVRKNFPEANGVKWQKGYWTFEKVSNGLVYSVQINSNGEIYERLDFTSRQYYILSTADRAALMMQNGLENILPVEDHRESWEQLENNHDAYVSQFIGCRPF